MRTQVSWLSIVIAAAFLLSGSTIPFSYGVEGDGPGVQALPGAPPVDYYYRNYTEIREILTQTVADHPEIAALHDIGDSWEKTAGIADRDILAIKISDNVGVEEGEPEFLLMALHHAREWPTSETALHIILNLTDGYGVDPRISWLVDNREIWIVPVVNPDGLDFALTENEDWRKNRRDNLDGTFGVDLNRNYNGSENGDPLGEWGGAGTSDLTYSDVYCGEAPFSEPETQAIRDLARAHDFQIAFDFHTFDDSVMWPWGYTTNLTLDDEYLVDIGQQLAALNGYDAAQSVALYPTTGDSLDWLYGSLNIYSILFEMGATTFHPDRQEDVLEIVYENEAPTLLGIELAGDRLQLPFDILHTPLSDLGYSESGFEVSADITAQRGVDTSALKVVYRSDGGGWQETPMSEGASNDTYVATIPSQPSGTVVEYYISAEDLGAVELTNPRYAPYEAHSFSVLSETNQPPVADAGYDITVTVGEQVEFDASGSSDDSGIVSYLWEFVYNGSVWYLDGPSASFSFWTPGVYEVTLTVADSQGSVDSDVVLVTVESTAIPEFTTVLLPVAAMLAVFLVIRARRP
ncbi:MAG: M14 family zinc carboxypeptidase [Thermoplasmata archaeon]